MPAYADVCCEIRSQLHGYISALESDGSVLVAELKEQMDNVAALRGLSLLASLLVQKYLLYCYKSAGGGAQGADGPRLRPPRSQFTCFFTGTKVRILTRKALVGTLDEAEAATERVIEAFQPAVDDMKEAMDRATQVSSLSQPLRTYPHLSSHMIAYADVRAHGTRLTYHHRSSPLLTYPHLSSRMLTYADVCLAGAGEGGG
jgi:hypothetical protein